MPEGFYDHRAARAAWEAGALMGVRRWAEMVLGEAQRDAPIDTGALRGIGTILEGLGEGVPPGEVWIVFALIYAAYQHEGHRADGSYQVHNHPKGGKIKYLEDPVKAHAHELDRAIAAGQRLALAALGGMG